jgi:hypothetical protein
MMYDKKNAPFKSPDLQKLQAVVINLKTTIYIALGADPGEARKRYFTKLAEKRP